ncbi:UbiD family decarboxylase [Natrinema versiforme]|nr:UbiD family decarboxylase [Natrinema versiforme]
MTDNSNLRTFLSEIAQSEGLTEITNPISPDLAVTEVLWSFEQAHEKPAVWFDSVNAIDGTEAEYPVVTNLFADRKRCAQALNSTVRDVGLEYYERERQQRQIKPQRTESATAPVKDHVVTGQNCDLSTLPIITHHEGDAGPYITAGVCIVPSPPDKDWGYNAATIRLEYRGPRELGLFMIPGRHTASYFEAYEENDEDMPIAIVLGHHPTFHFGAQTLHSIDIDEYNVIGGMRKSALPVVESATLGDDLLIPADAEIVLEGEVQAGDRIEEGPFGEYAGYYGDQAADRHKVRVSGMNCRSDAIFHDIFAGHPDHLNLGGIPIEGRIYDSVKETVSSVENVYLPPSGNCRQHCYVKIDKKKPGQGRNAILAALAPYDLVKHVIIVDSDVNLFDDRDILWAIATRSQWDKDLIAEGGFSSITLDPSAENYEITARGGIDATMELDEEYPDRLESAGIDVEEFLDSATKTLDMPDR